MQRVWEEAGVCGTIGAPTLRNGRFAREGGNDHVGVIRAQREYLCHRRGRRGRVRARRSDLRVHEMYSARP